MDKTFAAIEKLKGVELELLRLKNALDMMNKAYESKRGWKGLTDEEIKQLWKDTPQLVGVYSYTDIAHEVEAKLKEKNGG